MLTVICITIVYLITISMYPRCSDNVLFGNIWIHSNIQMHYAHFYYIFWEVTHCYPSIMIVWQTHFWHYV